jgi:putative FmdB family regulatory protein
VPVYEYRCNKGHQYEKTEGFDAPVEQPCSTCGSRARRQISMPAVIFKGPGFYSTDNRKSSWSGNGSSSSDGHDSGHSHSAGSETADATAD